MESTSWKQGWRLWSSRGYTEAIDTRTGDRLVMRLAHRAIGVTFDRFGPNVGQPMPRPPVHPLHRDLPEMATGLKLGCWTLDGCYEIELERPEVHARIILADSRSLACGPSDDPTMRQGVLLAEVECLRLEEGAELTLEAVEGEQPGLRKMVLEGPARLQGERFVLREGLSHLAVGRLPETINREKAFKRIRQMVSYVRHFGTAQLSGPQRMGHAVRWNICWDPHRREIYLPPARSWIEMMATVTGQPDSRRGPLVLSWASLLGALLVSRSEPLLARAIVRSILARQQPDGRIPPMSLGPHHGDRGTPPLLPLAVWYLCYDSNLEFAAEVFPQLALAHRWVIEHREPRRDGLLCWGDDRGEKRTPLRIDGWVGAAYESRMDNSPMWEELGFDGETQTMGRACLDLCAYAALSARVLAVLAERIDVDPAPFRADYRRIHGAVNGQLWGYDETYHNMRCDGSLGERISPTSLYPLLAGIVPRDRVAPLINRYLRSRETFWGYPGLPSLARNSPFFDGDADYWRGRVWPAMNYLVWAGLRQHSPAEAVTLAEVSRDLFDGEWERERHVHENYSAATGQGEPRPGTHARSCPLHCTGGLLLLPDLEGKTGGAIARLPRLAVD